MDIQLFATDEELQDFPESKTDSTVLDKTPNSNSINPTASDLPRSHSDLPKIPSRLPEHKSKCKSRKDHRCKSRSNTRSKNHDVMDLIPFQIQGPESKFNPLFLKESQVKDLMLIC